MQSEKGAGRKMLILVTIAALSCHALSLALISFWKGLVDRIAPASTKVNAASSRRRHLDAQ